MDQNGKSGHVRCNSRSSNFKILDPDFFPLTCNIVMRSNFYYIAGRGIPNALASGGCPVKIAEDLLPCASDAADLYDAERGSSLTRQSSFGRDPFASEEERNLAQGHFSEAFGDLSVLFDHTVNNNPGPLEDALQHLIRVST